MALMGFREYARHRNVTLRAVQKAVESGRIRTVGEGRDRKIDADQADRDWREQTDPAKQSLLNAAGSQLPQGQASTAAAAGDDGEDGPKADDTAEYRAARAKREQVRLAKEQLELEQLRGTLVDVAEAKRLVFTAFRTLRDAVLNVPSRVKDHCAAEQDALRVEQLIEAELEAALGAFKPDHAMRDADDEDEDSDDAP